MHQRFLFSNRQAPQGVTVETDFLQVVSAPFAQLGVHSPLNNPEKRLVLPPVGFLAASCPSCRQLHGGSDIVILGRIGGAFIEAHDDVAAERFLDPDRLLRCNEVGRSVQMGAEANPLLADFPQVAEAEDLKPAAVGQDRPVPVHEPMEPSQPADQLMSRAQVKMVGIGQDDLSSGLPQLFGSHRLHRRLGTDRHENRGIYRAMGGCQRSETGGSSRVFFKYGKCNG